MKTFTVFYADQVHDEFETFQDLKLIRIAYDREIYNGAYVYHRPNGSWYRMDGTPMFLSDVPKRLRVLVLLLS